MPDADSSCDRRGVRARPRTEGRVFRARRQSRRRARSAVRGRRSRRAEQREDVPDGSARAAAHPRGQRRAPDACSPSSDSRRAGPAPSSPIPTARRSCSRWRWRRCVQFGIRRVLVTTMQAVSGAGYPGVASLDILGNIVPFIGGGEEEKIETETTEDSRRRRRPSAARRRHQRAGESRARDRRSLDDRVRRAGIAPVGPETVIGRDARRSADCRRT